MLDSIDAAADEPDALSAVRIVLDSSNSPLASQFLGASLTARESDNTLNSNSKKKK